MKTRKYDRAKSMTPIRRAALSNHERILQHFMDRKEMDVAVGDEHDRTALHRASQLGHDKIVQMPLDRGAQVNVSGSQGRTGAPSCSVW